VTGAFFIGINKPSCGPSVLIERSELCRTAHAYLRGGSKGRYENRTSGSAH
jgi:hypothetical protein